MVGTEALLVLDSDGAPDHNECMEFLAKGMWESKLFNPTSEESPFEGSQYGGLSWVGAWDHINPFRAPGVRRVLLDVMYTQDTEKGERIQGFTPIAHAMGTGSVKCIVVLYSFMRPIHPPRLVLATHKCDGKGSGSGGHFPVGWTLHHTHTLSSLIAGLAEHVLGVTGWGGRMGVSTLSYDTIASLTTHASQAFPQTMLKHDSKRRFDPYYIEDVIKMRSVAPKVANCVTTPRTTLLDPQLPSPRSSPRRDPPSPHEDTSHKRHITRATTATTLTPKMQKMSIAERGAVQ